MENKWCEGFLSTPKLHLLSTAKRSLLSVRMPVSLFLNRQSLVAGFLLASTVHAADLVPGLPVFSADGSVDTSRTVPGFQSQVWRLTQPDTLAVRNTKIQVDGQGKAWVAWSFVATGQWMEYESFGHLTTLVGVHLAELDANGLSGPPVSLLPLGDYYAWMYDIAIGPHGRLWCALGMLSYESYYEEESYRDWDRLFRIGISPCGESPRVYEELPLPRENRYRLGFMDGEPVLVDGNPWEHAPVIYWVGSDNSREVPGLSGCCFSSSSAVLSPVGPSLAMLWSIWAKFPTSGGIGSILNYVSMLHSDSWLTSKLSSQYWIYGEGEPIDRYYHFSDYTSPKAIGSDGRSRVLVLFVEDAELETEPGDNLGPYIVETIPQVRTYDIASADSVGEWTLGYEKFRGAGFPDSTQAGITSNHNAVGFAISRSGKLDLWVFVDESWYGPYPIVSGSSGPALLFPDIAVDADGRYWLAWDDGADVYAAMVTPADLGLEDIATAVSTATIDDRSLPATPTLGQNSPNPFNAQTAIEVHIPAAILGDTAIDIFNLGGQLVRSLAVSRGSTRITWDGTSGKGLPVASGVYLYRLRVGERTWALRRMILVR